MVYHERALPPNYDYFISSHGKYSGHCDQCDIRATSYIIIIRFSKYFPVSDWLKPHA